MTGQCTVFYSEISTNEGIACATTKVVKNGHSKPDSNDETRRSAGELR